MVLGVLDSYFRLLTSEPDATGRWSSTDVATLINQSRYSISAELDWPQGNITSSTVAGQMEYTLPTVTKILRVYVGGQIIIPTSIPSLQGDQIEFYDQTAANNAPQWNSQNATVYPVTGTSFAGPYPSTLPFVQGARPQWYQRGGNLGLVPPPAGIYTISIDIVPRPAALAALTDVDNCYDEFFKEAICQGAVMRALQADKDQQSRMAAAQARAEEMKRLKSWVEDMTAGAPRGPMPVVYRGFYQNNGNGVLDG